jgi:hypothetical protein
MPKGTFDLKAWALVGAQQRLNELEQEKLSIFSAFPELRSGTDTAPRRRGRRRKNQRAVAVTGGVDGAGVAAAAKAKKRKRRKMSAAKSRKG